MYIPVSGEKEKLNLKRAAGRRRDKRGREAQKEAQESAGGGAKCACLRVCSFEQREQQETTGDGREEEGRRSARTEEGRRTRRDKTERGARRRARRTEGSGRRDIFKDADAGRQA